jgi:outer membrane protein
MRTFASALALAAALGLAAPAYGHEAGDWLVRFGASNIDPKSDNGSIDLTATGILGVQDITVDSKVGVTFNVAYMYTDTIGIELLAALPFKHDINVAGLPEPAASVTHLPPTLSMQYHFLPTSEFQPYVGAGVNYTHFFDDKLKGPLNVPGADITTDTHSFGLAFQVGFDYMLNPNWFVNVDLRWIDISTDATVFVPGLGTLESDVDIDPIVYGLHVGYRF